jgi:succinate dehydrogenase / fumarate reductase iron-sulfur subunit
MLKRGFGSCSNHYECQAACPKGIKVSFIARLNREFIKALGSTEVRKRASDEAGKIKDSGKGEKGGKS